LKHSLFCDFCRHLDYQRLSGIYLRGGLGKMLRQVYFCVLIICLYSQETSLHLQLFLWRRHGGVMFFHRISY
jgi:hypothetical protein